MSKNIALVFDLDDTLLMSDEYKKYEDIKFNKRLFDLLDKLTYDKYIYSNGTIGHVNNSLPRLLGNMKFIDKYARDIIPDMKPTYKSLNYVNNDIFYKYRFKNYFQMNCIFFDDLLDNLKSAKYFGWITVWLPNKRYNPTLLRDDYKFIDYKFDDIYQALENLDNIINNVR
tara:strand:- start:3721 stop:4233 length:513 start_codon:yes stop_codon:yes gene_type:complete